MGDGFGYYDNSTSTWNSNEIIWLTNTSSGDYYNYVYKKEEKKDNNFIKENEFKV